MFFFGRNHWQDVPVLVIPNCLFLQIIMPTRLGNVHGPLPLELFSYTSHTERSRGHVLFFISPNLSFIKNLF